MVRPASPPGEGSAMTSIRSLCVFCGSKAGADPAYAAAARRLGALIAGRGVRLVYGGGTIGLMGMVADAVLGHGGHVIGVIPEFLMKYEVGHKRLSELIVTDSMHDRKRRMFELADAFVVLPGGLGTLDETFEIVTWKQLRLHDKPIVVLDIGGFWQPFADLVAAVVEKDFAHPAVAELFTVVRTPEDVFAAIAAAPTPKEEVLTSHL
jgi:uncharacterized protein (TIGR00730 family)